MDVNLCESHGKRKIQLYIHIPFCQEKCGYCDFLSFQSCKSERQVYVDALIQEIGLYKDYADEVIVSTIFLGGGTPSILDAAMMEAIFKSVNDIFTIEDEAEISIECNPGTVNKEKLQAYKRAGINRISLGLQATNDEELKNLGRIHNYQTFLDTYQMVRESGYTNVNVDLMSAIPGQSVESWKTTLERIIELEPEHISAYSLIIEEGTKFWDVYGEDKPREDELPSEADEREMYYQTKKRLMAAGYDRYEVSNYSKKGYHCRHNLGYWDRVEYLGIGLGASSLLKVGKEQIRQTNIQDMSEYINMSQAKNKPIMNREIVDIDMQMEEFMFLGLRKMEGVSTEVFQEVLGQAITEVYQEVLDKLIEKELIEKVDNRIRFTEKGIDVSNVVLSEFLLG